MTADTAMRLANRICNKWKTLMDEVDQLRQQGKLDQAVVAAKKALSMAEAELGPGHPSAVAPTALAKNLDILAALYENQGLYAEAEPLHKRALAIREKDLGAYHPHVVTAEVVLSLNNLAAHYYTQGQYALAEPYLKRALELAEKTHGLCHPEVAVSLFVLAMLYLKQGQYVVAEPLLKRSLAINEKALGPDDSLLAPVLHGLGCLYCYQDQHAKAEPLFKRALAIMEKTLGPDHPELATSLNSLAGLYFDQGQYEVAEPLYKRALAIRKKVLGPDHPDVASVQKILKVLYSKLGGNNIAAPCKEPSIEPCDNERIMQDNELIGQYKDSSLAEHETEFFYGKVRILKPGQNETTFILNDSQIIISVPNDIHSRLITSLSQSRHPFDMVAPLTHVVCLEGKIPPNYITRQSHRWYLDLNKKYTDIIMEEIKHGGQHTMTKAPLESTRSDKQNNAAVRWIAYIAWTFAWVFIINFLIYGELIMPLISNPLGKIFAGSCSTAILVAGYIFIYKKFKNKQVQPDTKTTDQKATSSLPSHLRAPSIISQTPRNAGRNFVGPDPVDDKPYYAQAMKECEGAEGTRDLPTWAKAFSLTEGDANRAKAKYIELRVADMVAQERKRQQEQKIEDDKREFANKAEQLNQAQREFALRYPIGAYIPLLFKHYGPAMTRIPGESDEVYAARLQRFAKDYEKETGLKLG